MNKITSTIRYGNNVTEPDEWQRESNPWTVTLRYKGRQFTFPFWTGSAIAEPSTFDAAYCVLSDAIGDDPFFEGWAADYGYDIDSRKAEKIWRAVRRNAKRTRTLLGDDFYTFAAMDEDELAEVTA